MSEYIPKVGERCIVWDRYSDYRASDIFYYHAIIGKFYVGLIHDNLTSFDTDKYELRPIQSEAEIEKERKREEQIFKIKELLFDIEADNPTINAEDFYDSGVRVIAEDEYVVKALSDEQINTICNKALSNKWFISEIIEAIQRELGVIG